MCATVADGQKSVNSFLLSAEGVSAGFLTPHGNLTILSDISLKLFPNRIVGLIGPNGCGKSTLLRVLCGLIEPFTGKIIKGNNYEKPGMVFQEVSQNLVPWLSIRDNIAIACRLRGMDSREARNASTIALERVGLADLRNRYPAELSGGQQQLAALARWTVFALSILFFDEGWSMLDVVQRSKARTILSDLAKKNTGVIIVSHDLMELARCADEVFVLAGSPAKIRADIKLTIQTNEKEKLHKLWDEAFRAFNA